MSSERAGVYTSGTLDREKALGVLIDFGKLWDYHGAREEQDALDALEACVVPDPRLARIEALLDEAEAHAGDLTKDIWPDRTIHNPQVYVSQIRALLRDDT